MIWAWEAFDILSRQRQIGPNGPQPVTLVDLKAYCELRSIRTDRRVDFLLRVIPELDGIYLKKWYDDRSAQMDRERKAAEAKSRQAQSRRR